MNRDKLTWKDAVRDALSKLDGQGHLSGINRIVERNPDARSKIANNPTWQCTIRRVVRQYKIFEPLGNGVYKLLKEVPIKSEPQEFTKEAKIDHGIAQGMLVSLGRIYGYETYVPPRDQTIRSFQTRPLRDFISVSDCTEVFRGPNVAQVREIDTLWFDEDDYGLFPVYAFEVEETTGVKSGLDRLLKIPQRFREIRRFKSFIIAPTIKEKELFDKYINQTPFRNFRGEFVFRFYKELEELYNAALPHHGLKERFGISKR